LAGDDLVAEPSAGALQPLDGSDQVLHLDPDAVPAPWLGESPVGHGLSAAAGTGSVEQQLEIPEREHCEPGASIHVQVETEELGVKADRRIDVGNDVSNADGGHDFAYLHERTCGVDEGWGLNLT